MENKHFGIRWEVQYIDATGGHIKAKLWGKPKTHCYSKVDFRWSFSKDVTNVTQDEKIYINIAVDAQPGPDRNAPTDPFFRTFVYGNLWNEKVGGRLSRDGMGLFDFVGNYDRVGAEGLEKRVNDIILIAKDRSPAGNDLHAPDGGSGLQLAWQGNRYTVLYKYTHANSLPATKPVKGIGASPVSIDGSWSGPWQVHTLGTIVARVPLPSMTVETAY